MIGYIKKGPKRKNEPGPKFVSNDPRQSNDSVSSTEAFKVPGPHPSSSQSISTTSSISMETNDKIERQRNQTQ